MILTFSQERFEKGILEGIKTTTIRRDVKNRWKEGMKIHFWMHNPRNVSKKPHAFAIGEVLTVLDITISSKTNAIIAGNGTYRSLSYLDEIAKNDGFQDWEDMKRFFPETFIGKLIVFCNVKRI